MIGFILGSLFGMSFSSEDGCVVMKKCESNEDIVNDNFEKLQRRIVVLEKKLMFVGRPEQANRNDEV